MLGLLALGVIFLLAGKINSVVLDKRMGVMYQEKVNILCKQKKTEWALE